MFEILAKVSDLPTDVLKHLSKEEAALIRRRREGELPELPGLSTARAQAHAHASHRRGDVHQRQNARDQSRLSLADPSSSRPRPGGSQAAGPGGPEPATSNRPRREFECSFRRTSSRSIGNRNNEETRCDNEACVSLGSSGVYDSPRSDMPRSHCRTSCLPTADRFGWANHVATIRTTRHVAAVHRVHHRAISIPAR